MHKAKLHKYAIDERHEKDGRHKPEVSFYEHATNQRVVTGKRVLDRQNVSAQYKEYAYREISSIKNRNGRTENRTLQIRSRANTVERRIEKECRMRQDDDDCGNTAEAVERMIAVRSWRHGNPSRYRHVAHITSVAFLHFRSDMSPSSRVLLSQDPTSHPCPSPA